MTNDPPQEKLTISIALPENLAKRLNAAAKRSGRSLTDTVMEILDRNLPRLDQPVKKVPYS